jgi:predicted pyridoxine 5'-phosphate oxidase superfamily flavin-nucleotide-binding protein
MSKLYDRPHRDLQDRFETRRLADALEDGMRQALRASDQRFLQTRDMFFLTTIDHNGWPTVSYKGGAPGFIRIVDDRTIAFPCYDGNGMFYSVGNMARNDQIGLLFIDFETPRRLRAHGHASVSADDPLLAEYHEACLVVRVALCNIFTNCGRYIHRYRREAASEFVPQPGIEAPVPDWKRIDSLVETLPEKDREKAKAAGDLLTEDEWRREFWKGLE